VPKPKGRSKLENRSSKSSKSRTSRSSPLNGHLKRFSEILALVSPIPESFVRDDPREPKEGSVSCVYCEKYSKVISAFRKALKWTPDLDYALSVMFASVASTASVGDQLWIKVIGPPSCGKSTLCEALSVNSRWTLPKSTIRGFHSGFGDGKEDVSLISQVAGKTLITKDGDTLLQSPNKGQILAEGRDVYDTVSRTSYRNKASKDYTGIRMTWILAGTNSLRSIDDSELGERFLDCVMMEDIDDELEDEILWRVANRTIRNMGVEAGGTASDQLSSEMLKAYELSGGYVDYLRAHGVKLMSEIEVDNDSKRKFMNLGKFVAYMRARPSRHQDEKAGREFAARLVSQLTRLGMSLAVVLNKDNIDKEVINRTTRCALDTARGTTLEIAEHIFRSKGGLQIRAIMLATGMEQGEVKRLLRFLKGIGVVEMQTTKSATGKRQTYRWRLQRKVYRLFCEILGDPSGK
jgi:hypothetical protein